MQIKDEDLYLFLIMLHYSFESKLVLKQRTKIFNTHVGMRRYEVLWRMLGNALSLEFWLECPFFIVLVRLKFVLFDVILKIFL